LGPHVQTRGNGRQAGRHIRDAIDDDHAVATAPDHAISAPDVTKPGHGAQDTKDDSEERGRDRLSFSPRDGDAIKGEFDASSLRQIAEDWVGGNTSRPQIARLFSLLH